jgi:exonuclease SbcC
MITAVEFKNFKGQTGVQALTGLDIFTGRNGVGKTTRNQALGLGLLGYVPKNGKTPAETFKLATGDEMSIGLRTENFRFTRSFIKEEKTNRKTGETTTKIKENIAVSPGKGEANDTARNARITEEMGNFPVMLDFNEFLSLSDAKRRDFIYSLSPIASESWDKKRIHRYLGDNLLRKEIEDNNPEQYKVMSDLILEAMDEYPDGYGVQEGLQSMLDWVGKEKSIWSSKQKDAQGAVRQLSEMKNELQETDRNIAAMKEELETLQKQLIDVEKGMTADIEKKKAMDKRTQRLSELAALIKGIESFTPDITDYVSQIEELKKQIIEVKSVDVKQHNETQSEIRIEIKATEAAKRSLLDEMSTVTATVKALEAALKSTGSLAGHCVIHNMISCPKDFSGFDGYVEKKKADANEVVARLQSEIDKFNKKLGEMEAEEAKVVAAMNEVLQQANAVNRKNAELNGQIGALMNRKSAADSAKKDAANKFKMYQEELSRLTNEPVEAVTGIELLEKTAVGIRERIAELQSTIGVKEKAKQSLLLLQQSIVDNKTAEYKSICLKSIQESLGPKGIQGELVKELLEPIRQVLGSYLTIMGFDYEPFFQTESDTGKEVFQFGWINEKGHHVNFDALSTGQQTIFLAALLLVIMDRAQPKLRILVIDDMNHLDRVNFQLAVDGLAKVKDGLDNIILAGAIAFEFTAPEWTVWDLGDGDYTVVSDAEVKQSA